MKHVRAYREMSSNLLKMAEGLLAPLPWWSRVKGLIDSTTLLEIDVKGKREAEAHFDATRSTTKKIVIQMSHEPHEGNKGSLAHELTHAIQWLTGDLGDLMYITDVTRDLASLSDSPVWEKLIYALYLSCPQEVQAWQAESLYGREPILDEMLPWMRTFNPVKTAMELRVITPNPNRWGLESFDELPAFWSEAYEAYDEPTPGSQIPDMRDLTLEDFLMEYSEVFKFAARVLSR